jgi:hypothetical protein
MMPDQPYFDYQSYTPPMTHAGQPVQTKIVRIQDEQYQFAPHGSQSAFVSNEFAEEDDYYNAHLGADVEDLQGEEYYQEDWAYDHCYAAITAETSDTPSSETGPTIAPFHSAYLSAGVESPSNMARIHKLPLSPIPNTVDHWLGNARRPVSGARQRDQDEICDAGG